MRRTLRNTTALAVGLSVALPHFAVAQIQDRVRAPLVLAQADTAETAPVVVPPEAERSEEAAAVEAPAAEPVATEAEAAEPAAREAAAEPEPAAAEAPAAEAAAEPAAEAAAAADAAPAEPETDAAPEAEAAPEPEAAPAAAAEAATQPTAVEAPTPVQPEPAPTAEELAGQDAAAQSERTPEADTAVETEAAAAQAAPAATGEAKEPAPAQAEATADAASQPAARTPEPAATTEMPSEADLARALAGEEGATATEGGAAEAAPADAAATDRAPAADNAEAPAPSADAAVAPSAAAAPPADAAAAPAAQDTAGTATNAAPSEAELAEALAGAREVPEAEAQPTDAAREAAAADAAPAAAALADTEAPVATSDTRQVTEETARSATEDFLTDLQGTPRQGDAPANTEATQQDGSAPVVVGADGQPATAQTTQATDDKGDDRSNLERALRQGVLPALAGLAVGQLLSNNRRVELNTGDRVVVTRPDGSQQIIKDDNALLLRPGSTVQTEEYADGSTRTIVTREDGSQVVTIRDADLRVLRRTLVRPDGTTTALIDETASVAPVDVASLPPPARPITVAPGEQLSEDALREALRRETQVNRTFTLGQIRNIPEVRALVAPVDIQAITFDTGSAAIKSDQAQALSALGRVIAESVRQNPSEIYLIEGHTDTVGADAMNLALSDRRAESVALALTEFFQVPPENMVVQGYGEQFLKVPQEGDVRANRRVAVRRITDLLARN